MYGIEGLLAGRTLVERYRIDAVVGRGGMGAVYLAHDLRLGREVAVKVITVAAADADAHRRLRARFQREARAAAGVHHPNVVQVYDFGSDPVLGLDFLVMELLRGEDLATRINRKGPPAVPTALDIVYQAARGLGAGHRAGLVHRDVKPGNLFLEPGDRIGQVRVKVLDFGIADIGALEDGTVTHLTVVGRSPFSPAYASPEQLKGDDRLTFATDVFSLGAVAFHLLTGRRVSRATDASEMIVELSRTVGPELQRIPGLPLGARAVLQRALSPDSRDRFADAGALAVALEPLIPHPATRSPEAADEEERSTLPEAARQSRDRSGEPSYASRESAVTGTRVLTAPPAPAYAPYEDAPLPRRTPAPAPAPAPALEPPPRPSWLRRTTRAAWELCLTAAASILFAGAWFMVTAGFQDGDMTMVYVGAAASVVGTPWAIHRVLRRPGSYRFAFFTCAAASAVILLLLRDRNMEKVLALVFVAQVGLSLAAERLTRPREIDLPD